MQDSGEMAVENEQRSEIFRFNFHDRSEEMSAVMQMCIAPGGINEAFLFVMTEGLICGMHSNLPEKRGDWQCGGLSFSPEGGGWRLTFSGQLASMTEDGPIPIDASMDVLWTPLNDDFVQQHGVRNSEKIATLEQHWRYGEAVGSLQLGEEGGRVRGLGAMGYVQDNPESSLRGTRISCQLDRRTAFDITLLGVSEKQIPSGFVHRDGESIPIRHAELDIEYSMRGRPVSFDLHIVDAKGRRHIIQGEALREAVIPIDMESRRELLFEILTRISWLGKEGYGITEYYMEQS